MNPAGQSRPMHQHGLDRGVVLGVGQGLLHRHPHTVSTTSSSSIGGSGSGAKVGAELFNSFCEPTRRRGAVVFIWGQNSAKCALDPHAPGRFDPALAVGAHDPLRDERVGGRIRAAGLRGRRRLATRGRHRARTGELLGFSPTPRLKASA